MPDYGGCRYAVQNQGVLLIPESIKCECLLPSTAPHKSPTPLLCFRIKPLGQSSFLMLLLFLWGDEVCVCVVAGSGVLGHHWVSFYFAVACLSLSPGPKMSSGWRVPASFFFLDRYNLHGLRLPLVRESKTCKLFHFPGFILLLCKCRVRPCLAL